MISGRLFVVDDARSPALRFPIDSLAGDTQVLMEGPVSWPRPLHLRFQQRNFRDHPWAKRDDQRMFWSLRCGRCRISDRFFKLIQDEQHRR